MKKYLMTGIAAVAMCAALTSCSHDLDFDPVAQEQQSEVNYESAFTSRFGEIAENHEWGFDQFREDVTRGAYPNGNMWESEGWNVPPVLSAGQKERVYKYFQCHTPIGYKDPGWTNFWIQQVYKGHTDPNNSYSKTKEEYTSANNGQVIGGDHMDHLAAIGDGKFDHIYDFNNSDSNDYGGRMLMTNSTTKSFGYFNSDGSLGHTEYTGLVHWSVIDEWGEKEKVGASLNDGWNRSFMGFDFEQVVGEDIYEGEAVYTCPAFDGYIWDGTNVIQVAEQDPAQNYKLVYKSGYEHMTYKDADGKTKKVYFLTAKTNQYCGILSKKGESDVVIEKNGHKCVDMVKITGYLRDGYLPVSGSDMKDWVKVQGGADGYYSDWIVTLCEAKKNNETPKVLPDPNVRVFAEDLDVKENFDGKEYHGDFDFNDVVFDVIYDDGDGNTWIILQAAGGTYHIEVDGVDVHKKFGVPDNKMVNTHGYGSIDKKPVSVKLSTHYSDAALIPVIVTLPTGTRELTAAAGKAPHKLAVAPGTDWAGERISIETVYPDFYNWVRDPTLKWWQ